MRILIVLVAIMPLGCREDPKTKVPSGPITEVSLERSPCYGTCPWDKIVVRADGVAEYTGTKHVKRLGTYKGKIGVEDFQKLAKLLVDNRFFDLKARYEYAATDLETLTTAVKRGSAIQYVSNYGGAAPAALREIENHMIDLMEKVEWTGPNH